jgi:Ca2+-binding RTX toxin-like protein
MLADLLGRVRRARSTKHESKGRWRLWPCLLVALVVPAAFASVASADDTHEFKNENKITIPGTVTNGIQKANPYPSIISIDGYTAATINKVTVTFQNLTHTWPDDIDAVLVHNGKSVLLMSDTGGSGDINVDLTFDDAAPTNLPDGPQISKGTFKPTNFDAPPNPPSETLDSFPGTGLTAPFGGVKLDTFTGTDPNGQWQLFLVDDYGQVDSGSMDGGFSLKITTPTDENPHGSKGSPAGKQNFRSGACANLQRGTSHRDRLRGTKYGDRLRGGRGNDVLKGGRGRDCLFGGPGRDRLSGGSGKDRLFGNSGSDRLSGNSGNDRLSGGSGNDRLSGGSGKDRLKGGSGRNRYSGGSGGDSINSKNGRKETVRCGSGRDKVRADGSDRLIGCEVVL